MTNPEYEPIVVTLSEDEDGNLILPIPMEVLEILDWREGDEIAMDVDEESGEVILSLNG